MPDEIGLFEAIDTQRALRYIKPDPVPPEMLDRILSAATRAPSGGNNQPWEFVIVQDQDVKTKIARFYRQAWDDSYGQSRDPGPLGARSYSSAEHLAHHIAEAPLWIFVCVRHDGSPPTMWRGASVYPAVQNMLLAARGLGLASVLTTFHTRFEKEVAEILGLPENVQTAALLPFGFPEDGRGYGPTRRAPVDEFLHFDRW
ncbi:MAG: nitroreductase family protein [Chloroflexi bacterium]|nr:nitroreductase family protein [Chloroflexota bacterium]